MDLCEQQFIDSDDDIPLSRRKNSNEKSKLKRRLSIVGESSCVAATRPMFEANNLSDPKSKWDGFCWGCHKKCGNTAKGIANNVVRCSNCVISFHMNCIPDKNRYKTGWQCLECQSKQKCPNNDNLTRCFKYVIERVLRKTVKVKVDDTFQNGIFNLPNGYTNSSLLINPLTFEDVLEKAKRLEYVNTHDFLLDIKWLRHNCEILYFDSTKLKKKTFLDARNNARIIQKRVAKETKILEDGCAECYLNNNVDIYMVCSKPHLLVWAQFDIYPYWPAKITSTSIGEGSKLDVFFFKDHTSAIVSCDNCFLYLNKDPNEYITDQYKDDIKTAMEEANKYIKNIEKKYGLVQLPPTFIKPTFAELDTTHLDEIIPGFRNPENRVRQNVPEELLQTSNDNCNNDENHFNSDISSIDNSKPDDQSKCPHKSTAKNHRSCIPINKAFVERVRAGQQEMREMKSELELQRTEIIKLKEENERLKSELAHAKRTEEISKQFESK